VKEFIEQVKLYKEYVLTIAAIVGGISLLMNYFATNEELMTTKQTLNRLINERECWLSSRITISEVAAAIANLERERLEKTRLKIDLSSQAQTQLSPVNELYKKEQLDQISKDFQRIDEELKAYRVTSKIASDNLFNGTCRILKEVP
jgi:predicted nucleic acid-binding protein